MTLSFKNKKTTQKTQYSKYKKILVDALKHTDFGNDPRDRAEIEKIILDYIDGYPKAVSAMMTAKDLEGKTLFSPKEVLNFLQNSRDVLFEEKDEDKIATILSNPEEIKIISGYKNKAYALWRAAMEPLDSTVLLNPELFPKLASVVQRSQQHNDPKQVLSFDDFFAGYENYDQGGKSDQRIIADAKRVFERLKTPEAIEQFTQISPQEQHRIVKGLDEGHSGGSFSAVCHNAYKYALYKATEAPYTFDEFFAGYKNYDQGGELDQGIIADTKRVFETLRTPEAIEEFAEMSPEEQYRIVKGLSKGHSGSSFYAVCKNAYLYAQYAQKYVKENSPQKTVKKQKTSAPKGNVTDILSKRQVELDKASARPRQLRERFTQTTKEEKTPLATLYLQSLRDYEGRLRGRQLAAILKKKQSEHK